MTYPTASALLITSQTPSDPSTTNISVGSIGHTSISGSADTPILCPWRSPRVLATAKPGPSSSAHILKGPYDFSSLSILPPALRILSFSIYLLGLWSVLNSYAQSSAFLTCPIILYVHKTALESPTLIE